MVVVAGFAAPVFVSRSMIQDLFFILTMLMLAQCWNLLAGYAGLVSVGQQAFVGFGAYAMFAAVILARARSAGRHPARRRSPALLLAVPTAFFVFRLQGAYFAIGTWVIAEVVRLLLAQWKALGGGTGTSLPRERDARHARRRAGRATCSACATPQARDIVAYWLALVLAVATIGVIYWLLRSRHGLALAAVRDNQRGGPLGRRRCRPASSGWSISSPPSAPASCGALIYVQKARISPDAAFSVIDWTAYVIFIVVIGGIGTHRGADRRRASSSSCCRTLLADYGTWYLLMLGLIAIVVMLFAPRGLWGLFSDRTGLQLFPVRRRLAGPLNDRGRDLHG